MRHRGRRHSRPYDCGDDIVDEYNNNNNKNYSNVTAVTTINNTTHLIDELEQLRTDNFQLRLRVYNWERRVDRLSAAALARDRKKRSDYTDTDSDDSDASSGTDHNNAAAKATAEAAVRTIHDLLTVNRRLLALLAATVSAKAVSVSTDDKRRWQRLRNHIEEYAVDGQVKTRILLRFRILYIIVFRTMIFKLLKHFFFVGHIQHEEKTNEEENDEFHDASATDSETSCKAQVLSAERSATRQNVLRSPPPPPQPPPSTQLETAGVQDDEGAGSEVSRLRGRCRRLERSLQQLVNTELWARNRQIGKLEQQRYVTQVADAAAQRDRRPTEQAVTAAVSTPPQQQHLQKFPSKAAASTASPPATKGILIIRSAVETPCAAKLPSAVCKESQTAAASSPPKVATITTPPPVLPDYSEVNFFFSCDEEDDDDDDDDDHDRRENSTETKSSSEEETVDSNDCKGDEEPVRLAAVGAPLASSTSTRKRHCRPHHRLMQQPIKSVGDSATVTTTTSSSTESAAAEEEADEFIADGVIMTTTTATSPCTTRRHRTVSGGGGLHRRRRCRPPRRCSTCGRCSGSVDAAAATADRPRPPSVVDAQVQCGDGNVATDHGCNSDRGGGELQLQQLRRELDARRRENGRLYDMLLRLQRGKRPGDRGKGDGGPRIPSSDFSDSDQCGSPEPYRQAAGVVRGSIADLLPPLLSMRSISDDDDDDDDGGNRSHQRYRPDGAEQQQQQQQQQLQLLTRLRERIVAYERRELNGGDDRAAAVGQQLADPSDDAVRRMDRTDLVNVALPRVVERLRRALVPLLQHRPENAVAAASVRGGAVNGGGDFVIDGARSLPPSGGR